jgi:hypothetical protein
MRGPCRRFIGNNKGRLRVVAAEKRRVKDTKPSWKRDEVQCSAVQCSVVKS